MRSVPHSLTFCTQHFLQQLTQFFFAPKPAQSLASSNLNLAVGCRIGAFHGCGNAAVCLWLFSVVGSWVSLGNLAKSPMTAIGVWWLRRLPFNGSRPGLLFTIKRQFSATNKPDYAPTSGESEPTFPFTHDKPKLTTGDSRAASDGNYPIRGARLREFNLINVRQAV